MSGTEFVGTKGEYVSAPTVSRVEVIDSTGRAFVGYFEPGALIHFQDDFRTVKVFVGERREP